MMKSTSGMTLALFLTIASASVWAQDQQKTEDPALAKPPATTSDAPAAKTDAPVKPAEGQIVLQDLDTMLVSGLVGAYVYSPSDEWIGDVNDLIVDTKGALKGVVIGVGGVMGIGEKEVAFEISKLTFTPSEDRSTAKLILNATREELAGAPSFKSASTQIFEKEQEQPRAPLSEPPQPQQQQ